MTFTKVAHRVYIATVRVSLNRAYDIGSFETTVKFRLDGREGRFYRVDLGCLTGWEAIDGGRDNAPKNLKDAKAMANDYLKRVREQGTLHPRQEAAA